jgi:chromosomal replication initiator protein
MTPLAERLVKHVAEKRGLRASDITGRSRLAPIVAARHEVWALLRSSGWSLPAIGREFDVDHTTVLHAVRKLAPVVRVRVAVEPRVRVA